MALAQQCAGEIINADSVQFYRGYDIGSAKPGAEDLAKVPHHLLDVVSWDEDFSAGDFARRGREVIGEIASREKLPLVVGGSGLYLRSLWGEKFHQLPSNAALKEELRQRETADLYAELIRRDALRAQKLHPNDRVRILRSLEVCILSSGPFSDLVASPAEADFAPALKIFINPAKSDLHRRIEQRVDGMLRVGLIHEVRELLINSIPNSRQPQFNNGCLELVAKPMRSIGYSQVVDFLAGKIHSEEKLREKIIIATKQYAKQQMTWFKKLASDVVVADGGKESLATLVKACYQLTR
jgi:tRNA dimethylallyltransferase